MLPVSIAWRMKGSAYAHTHALRDFEVFHIGIDGRYNAITINKREALDILPPGIRLRDLRNSNDDRRDIAELLARDDHFIVNVDHMRVVVTRHNLLLFEAHREQTKNFASRLRHVLQKEAIPRKAAVEPSQYFVTCEPFEFVVLDEILNAILSQYHARLALILPVVDRTLTAIAESTSANSGDDDSLIRLIPMQRALSTFQTSVKELYTALEDTLADDLDVERLCLTFKSPKYRTESTRLTFVKFALLSSHSVVEMLVENYSKRTEEMLNEVKQMQQEITATHQVVDMTMNSNRNYLMRLNLHISLAAMSLAAGSVIAGVFGMNLTHGFEEHATAFYAVLTSIPITIGLIYSSFAFYYLSRKRLFAIESRSAIASQLFRKINSSTFIDELRKTNDPEHFARALDEAAGTPITKHMSPRQLQDLLRDLSQDSLNDPNNPWSQVHHPLPGETHEKLAEILGADAFTSQPSHADIRSAVAADKKREEL